MLQLARNFPERILRLRVTNIRALIWDMGGVLVRNMDSSVRGRLGEPYGLTSRELEDLYFGNEMSAKAAVGLASETDSWNFVQKRLNICPEDMPDFIRTFWSCDRFDEELFQFSMALRPSLKVGLLSNATAETRASLQSRFPRFYEMFDVVIFSAEVKLAKPDPRIYALALQELGVYAEEVVFVDDFIENIEAARALGIHAIHFQNSQQARSDILALLNP
jgi:HAD superfamily hydrolase (TIGR01549 family)